MGDKILPAISLNLHLTQRCNMSCRGCFAKYSAARELGRRGWSDALDVIARETRGRYRVKINFAGGEPTLLPYLPFLVEKAKSHGMITSIISNGSLLRTCFLNDLTGTIDWIGISIDSLDALINCAIGRSLSGNAIERKRYIEMAHAIRSRGILLKINTVVNKLNSHEDFSIFMNECSPDRWKVMQFLLIQGQNDAAKGLSASPEEFSLFVNRHIETRNLVTESAAEMKGSYAMIDPAGRPYGNSQGTVRFGRPLLEAGLLGQLPKLGYEPALTAKRGGFYY